MTNTALVRSSWGWRLWFAACVLVVVAGLQQAPKRGIFFGVAVVFGIIAARQRRAFVNRA